MVIAMTSPARKEEKNSPEYLRPGQMEGETEVSVQGRVGGGFPHGTITAWEPTCCRDCAPPPHSHVTHLGGGPSPLPEHATWRLQLRFCNCMAPDSQQRFAEWLRLEGALGVIWSKSSCLHLCGYYLCYTLSPHMQGMLRRSSLALLTRFLGKNGV